MIRYTAEIGWKTFEFEKFSDVERILFYLDNSVTDYSVRIARITEEDEESGEPAEAKAAGLNDDYPNL